MYKMESNAKEMMIQQLVKKNTDVANKGIPCLTLCLRVCLRCILS